MKSIAIDMDDVIADCTGKFIKLYNRDFGEISLDNVYGKEISEAVDTVGSEQWIKWIHEKGFFRDLDVIQDSVEVVGELCKKYDVYIVSAASEFRNSYEDKYDWLAEHFPFIKWTHIVFCGDKSIIGTDFMIDDRTRNLKTFKGKPYLFSASHNMNLKGYDRIESWRHAGEIFL